MDCLTLSKSLLSKWSSLAVAICIATAGYAHPQQSAVGADTVADTITDNCADTIAEADMLRPVTQIYTLEIGERSARAEYLSPIAYSGTEAGISGWWNKVLPFAPRKAMMAFDAHASYASMLNPAGNASMMSLSVRFAWEMRWYTRLPHSLTLSIGGGPAIDCGAMALLRNSNNPVDLTLKAYLRLGASLSWRSKIARVPILLEERLATPLIGAFFMPQYGETFYEIYLGNTRGLAHCGWPGNMAGLANNLTLTLDLGTTALTAGYRFDISSARANSLHTVAITHAFVIGVIPHGLGMKRKPSAPELRPY